jgi:hypothetical protein
MIYVARDRIPLDQRAVDTAVTEKVHKTKGGLSPSEVCGARARCACPVRLCMLCLPSLYWLRKPWTRCSAWSALEGGVAMLRRLL